MGVIPNTAQGGMFKVQKDNYHGPYAAGTQNGVTSKSCGKSNYTSFRVSAMK